MESSSLQSVDEVVREIMRIHKSLPTRPGIDEVEAAKVLITNVEKEDQARLEAVARQTKSPDVPEELSMVLQEMQKNLIHFQSKEQRREALKLLDLDNVHSLFDELIQRASKCVSSSSNSNSRKYSYSNGTTSTASTSFPKDTAPNSISQGLNKSSAPAPAPASASLFYGEKEPVKTKELVTRDDSYVKKAKSTFYGDGYGIGSSISSEPQILDSSLKPTSTSGKHKCHSAFKSFLFFEDQEWTV